MAEVVPSEELRSLLLRLYSAMEVQDVETLREMFSTGAHALAIGTDPNEWWTGSEALEVWIVQIREAGGFRFQARKPVAYCVGPVGWVADEPLVTIANEESFGRAFTTSVDRIERSVRADRPDVGPASAPDGTVTIVFSDIESSTV